MKQYQKKYLFTATDHQDIIDKVNEFVKHVPLSNIYDVGIWEQMKGDTQKIMYEQGKKVRIEREYQYNWFATVTVLEEEK